MLNVMTATLVGAAIGDALGMPNETSPPSLRHITGGFSRPSRWHPNADLLPGQYTDDTQIMLIIAELLAAGGYSETAYADELSRVHAAGKLRFPDATIAAACEHITAGKGGAGGIYSATAGCVATALPFALICENPVTLREWVVSACGVTHSHPAAHGAAVACAFLISSIQSGMKNPLSIARKNAELEDATLGERIRSALELEAEGISLDAALSVLGNDVTVYQTLPLSFFLIGRYHGVEELLSVAAHVGGNTDTIGFICGAYAGATYGLSAFPSDLVSAVEGKGRMEILAERLHERYARKN
jgi:ADP-ribosylglycohydrolase